MRWQKDIGIDSEEVWVMSRILGANIRDFFDERVDHACTVYEGSANERDPVMESNIDSNMDSICVLIYYSWISWDQGPNMLDILGKMPIFEEIGGEGDLLLDILDRGVT